MSRQGKPGRSPSSLRWRFRGLRGCPQALTLQRCLFLLKADNPSYGKQTITHSALAGERHQQTAQASYRHAAVYYAHKVIYLKDFSILCNPSVRSPLHRKQLLKLSGSLSAQSPSVGLACNDVVAAQAIPQKKFWAISSSTPQGMTSKKC